VVSFAADEAWDALLGVKTAEAGTTGGSALYFLLYSIQMTVGASSIQMKNMLTPKFCTGGSLICGPNLVKKSRPEKEGFFKRIWQRCSRSAVLLPFGRGTICADFVGSHGDVARVEGMNGWISIRIWALF
jgi:hypothetical protein